MLKAMSTYVYVKERLHPGLLDGLVRGGAQAIEIFAARQHVDYAKPLGVRILLENIPNELCAPDKLVEFIHTSHFDDVGVCFDFGHAHITSNVPEAFEIVKNHIRSTHVHDNAGDRDSHLWPGKGSIDWKQAMELMRAAPHTPPLLLEIEADEKVNPIEKMGETFATLEKA